MRLLHFCSQRQTVWIVQVMALLFLIQDAIHCTDWGINIFNISIWAQSLKTR
jgi:hypothetical protein